MATDVNESLVSLLRSEINRDQFKVFTETQIMTLLRNGQWHTVYECPWE